MAQEGMLDKVETFAAVGVPEPGLAWKVQLWIDNSRLVGFTSTRLVLSVLDTALLAGRRSRRWPIEAEVDSESALITRVRIRDDREDFCKGVLPAPPDQPALPLSPTAFADETPPKWGFFFFGSSRISVGFFPRL